MVPTTSSSSQSEHKANDEQEQTIVANVLSSLCQSEIYNQSLRCNELHHNNNYNDNDIQRPAPYTHDINRTSIYSHYCTMPFQNYPYPNFLPYVQTTPQNMNHFNAPRADILPFLQSTMFQPQSPFYIGINQNCSISPLPQFEPPLHFPDYVPDPSRSRVTIQEIHELDSSASLKTIEIQHDSIAVSKKESQEAAKLQEWVPKKNFMAPAVQVRTVMPVCSAPPARAPGPTMRSDRRGPLMYNSRYYPRRNLVAPAVQVRTVVPVCSAPPARASGPAPEGRNETEGSAAVSSEFAKLQI